MDYAKNEHPIIYIRGYAGSQSAVEATVSTPYMGFNLGSTKYRMDYDKKVWPWVFESPLIRLMKDHNYTDAYRDGGLHPEDDTGTERKQDRKTVWIFRYYDVESDDFGEGDRKRIEYYAKELVNFISKVKNRVCHCYEKKEDVRVYLVAHSMGGLICRCFLQNYNIPDPHNSRKIVDKFFTYATPHGGIDFRKGLGALAWVRDLLNINNQANFGAKRIREMMALKDDEPLNSLNGKFPVERMFSLIGTDSRDYTAALGLSRMAVGPMSDGLVQIKDAYVKKSARAYVHRSHSGHYGIVNSEEGYQNLQRFLFGNLKVDITLEPIATDALKDNHPEYSDASYYIESEVYVRGLPMKLHERTIEKNCSIVRKDKELTTKATRIHTLFLLGSRRFEERQNVTTEEGNGDGKELAFSINIRIVPQYHFNKRKMKKLGMQRRNARYTRNYEDNPIFEDTLLVEIIPPSNETAPAASYRWNRDVLAGKTETQQLDWREKTGNKHKFSCIEFSNNFISGKFSLELSEWE